MLRKILAVVLGFVLGSAVNMALVNVSHTMYPLPADVDPNNFDAFREYVRSHGLPAGAFFIVLLAHAGGSFVSGLVCGLVAGRPWYAAAAALGLLWTCGGVAMLFMIPAPVWFAVIDVISYIPAALLGVKLGANLMRRPGPATAQAS